MHTAEEKEYIKSKQNLNRDTRRYDRMTGILSERQERKKDNLAGRIGKWTGIVEVYERNHPKDSNIVAKKFIQNNDHSQNSANFDASKNYGCKNSIKFVKQPKTTKPTPKKAKSKK